MKQMKECENSCKYYADFKDNDYYYIIMEKCDGDLTDLLKRYDNGLPEYLIKKILIQLNKAFKMMKNKNIIHRDLKPQNIFRLRNKQNLIMIQVNAIYGQLELLYICLNLYQCPILISMVEKYQKNLMIII